MRRHWSLPVFLVCALVLCSCAWVRAASDSRVVVVVAGGLSIRDLADPNRPGLMSLVNSGAAGLMNVRTGRQGRDVEPVSVWGMEAGCVSIGAGTMAVGGAEARRASSSKGKISGVPAADLYNYRTGHHVGRAEVIHTEIARLQRVNAAASYRARPGALGTALRGVGVKTAVVGNSDMPDQVHREAVTIAMDENGLVDHGDVDSPKLLLSDPAAAYGVRTDTAALLAALDRALAGSRFVVVDFGDMLRAGSRGDVCSEERTMMVRLRATGHLQEFLGQVSDRLDFGRDLLIVLSPNSRPFSDIEQERLAPIVVKGPGFRAGVLVSPSTRREGVVTIADIAPTILAFFKIKPTPEMVGRPIGSLRSRGVPERLLELNLAASTQAQRQVAMRGGSVVQSVVVVLVTLGVMLGMSRCLRAWGAWASLIPIALPLVMLYLPLLYSGGLTGAVVLLVFLTAGLLAACSFVFRSAARTFAWLCGAIVLSVIVDLVRGCPLIASSITGYSLAEGARYYGLGNELSGTLLGATLIGVGLALSTARAAEWAKTAFAAAVFAIVVIVVSAPSLGADAGGMLAALPALAIAALLRRGWKPTFRGAMLVLAAAVVAAGAFFALDAFGASATQSHVGRVAGVVTDQGLLGLVQIPQRKVALNLMLLSTSLWSRLLILCWIGSALLFWWGRRRRGREFLTGEEKAAALGCCIAIAGAFALNDSGVLAAATCSVFLWTLLALRALSAMPEDTVPEG